MQRQLNKKFEMDFDLSPETAEEFQEIASLLANETVLAILNALSNGIRISISDIARVTGKPVSTISKLAKRMEQSGLLVSQMRVDGRHREKICGLNFSSVTFRPKSPAPKSHDLSTYEINLPIGGYFDFSISAPCGIVTPSHILKYEDDVEVFYDDHRFLACLLWFNRGYVEYRTSLHNFGTAIEALELSFEMCSETIGYNVDWPSDVRLSINGLPVILLHLDGDYGDRKGRYNPEWYPTSSTQYGDFFRVHIDGEGTTLNGEPAGPVTIRDIMSSEDFPIFRLRFAVGEEGTVGGLNLFGENFGDHSSGLLLKVMTKSPVGNRKGGTGRIALDR